MILRILSLSILIMTIQACKRPDKNPEVRDPIYQDILKERAAITSIIEDLKKKIAESEKDYAKSQPRTMDRKNALNEKEKFQYQLTRAEEMKEFYDIRAERRRVETRREYRISFDKDLPWPNKSEYEAYLINKRLVHASRNWDARVPKTNHNQGKIDAVNEAAAADAAAEP